MPELGQVEGLKLFNVINYLTRSKADILGKRLILTFYANINQWEYFQIVNGHNRIFFPLKYLII